MTADTKKSLRLEMMDLFHYFPGICHICRAVETDNIALKHCSRCKLVAYCSVEHQRIHWPHHKRICNYIKDKRASQGLNSFFAKGLGLVADQWFKFRSSTLKEAEEDFGELKVDERDMFSFPRVCDICHSDQQPQLHDCTSCHCVSYCSREHEAEDEERHKKWCHLYSLILATDIYEINDEIYVLPLPPFIETEYKPLPECMQEVLSIEFKPNSGTTVFDPVYLAFASERLSYPLTLLHCLEKVGLSDGRPISGCQSLLVHIVGAEVIHECLGVIKWEYILHRLPKLKKLNLKFIGPNVYNNCMDYEDQVSGVDTRCTSCKSDNREMVHDLIAETYHDYCDSAEYQTPDVVCAFNAGFHENAGTEQDTWLPSLPFLVKSEGTPLVVTSYTKSESEKDLAAVQQLGNCSVLIPLQKNPFSSRRPFRDWERDDDSDFFYFNQYYFVVKQ